jgi:hypothetical protein
MFFFVFWLKLLNWKLKHSLSAYTSFFSGFRFN